MTTTTSRTTFGTCTHCQQKPTVFAILKLCDDCFAELNKIPAPKDDKAPAQEWNEYSRKRREFLGIPA